MNLYFNINDASSIFSYFRDEEFLFTSKDFVFRNMNMFNLVFKYQLINGICADDEIYNLVQSTTTNYVDLNENKILHYQVISCE